MKNKTGTMTWRGMSKGLRLLALACAAAAATAARGDLLQDMTVALDNTNLTFASWSRSGSSPNPWRLQTSQTHDGVDAMWSGGTLGDNQTNAITTTVTGPGVISFWYAVSSQQLRDEFSFEVDGDWYFRHSGVPTGGVPIFKFAQYRLGAGSHSLEWLYGKDGSGKAGDDAAYLDQVDWVPQPNDNMKDATQISGPSGSVWGTTYGATAEYGEPLPKFKEAATNTVWWTWNAPANSRVTFTTAGSDGDTVMGVYNGTSFSTFSALDENDDANTHEDFYDRTSVCKFSARQGLIYYIAVSGYGNNWQGTVRLNWQQAPSWLSRSA